MEAQSPRELRKNWEKVGEFLGASGIAEGYQLGDFCHINITKREEKVLLVCIDTDGLLAARPVDFESLRKIEFGVEEVVFSFEMNNHETTLTITKKGQFSISGPCVFEKKRPRLESKL